MLFLISNSDFLFVIVIKVSDAYLMSSAFGAWPLVFLIVIVCSKATSRTLNLEQYLKTKDIWLCSHCQQLEQVKLLCFHQFSHLGEWQDQINTVSESYTCHSFRFPFFLCLGLSSLLQTLLPCTWAQSCRTLNTSPFCICGCLFCLVGM